MSTPEQKHARYMRHREEVLARQREWRRANPELYRARARATYLRMRERKQRVANAWRAANRERVNIGARAARIARPDVRRAIDRRYRQAHPDVGRRSTAARRARKVSAVGAHTVAEWLAKVDAHGRACAYCGRRDVPLTEDHVVPLSRGGRDDIENIVPACGSCNSAKGARWTADEARARLAGEQMSNSRSP